MARMFVVFYSLLLCMVYSDSKLSIEIKSAPKYGSGSWGTINGECYCMNVINNISSTTCDENYINWSSNFSVVIYSTTDIDYIQPSVDDYYTKINSSGSWSNKIHLGYQYKVYLVAFQDKDNIIAYDEIDAITTPQPTTDSLDHTNDGNKSILYHVIFAAVMITYFQ